MKSDLQKAALLKLARLTQTELLSADSRDALRDRLLAKCAEQRTLLNGVNGVNGLSSVHRTVVAILKGNRNFQPVQERIQLQAGSGRDVIGRFNGSVSVGRCFTESLRLFLLQFCCSLCYQWYKHSSHDEMNSCDLEFEDPPSRQLAYSLSKTLFCSATILPTLESKVHIVFLQYLRNVHVAITSAISHQGSSRLDCMVNARCQATALSCLLSTGQLCCSHKDYRNGVFRFRFPFA